jgi:tetratricopeptide (TPR) repeat protein
MEQAFDIEKELGESLLLCNIYEKYSRIYLEKGEYTKFYEYGQKGRVIARALGSKVRIQTILMYVGFSAFYLGRYNQAIEHELEALALYEGEWNSTTSTVYIRLGRIYNSIEDYDQALLYLNESESILNEVDYNVCLAKEWVGMGYTYTRTKNFKEAFKNIEFARTTFEVLDHKINLSLAQRRMSQL